MCPHTCEKPEGRLGDGTVGSGYEMAQAHVPLITVVSYRAASGVSEGKKGRGSKRDGVGKLVRVGRGGDGGWGGRMPAIRRAHCLEVARVEGRATRQHLEDQNPEAPANVRAGGCKTCVSGLKHCGVGHWGWDSEAWGVGAWGTGAKGNGGDTSIVENKSTSKSTSCAKPWLVRGEWAPKRGIRGGLCAPVVHFCSVASTEQHLPKTKGKLGDEGVKGGDEGA
jgi:hypothetical protein